MVKCCRSDPSYPSIQWSVFREMQRAGNLALSELQLLLPEYSEAQLFRAFKTQGQPSFAELHAAVSGAAGGPGCELHALGDPASRRQVAAPEAASALDASLWKLKLN